MKNKEIEMIDKLIELKIEQALLEIRGIFPHKEKWQNEKEIADFKEQMKKNDYIDKF